MEIFMKLRTFFICCLLLIFIILLVEAGGKKDKKENKEKKKMTDQKNNEEFVTDLNLDHSGTWEADSQIDVSKLSSRLKKKLNGIRHHLNFKGIHKYRKKKKKGKEKEVVKVRSVEPKPEDLKTRKRFFWKCTDKVEFDARHEEKWKECKSIIKRIQAQGICGSCWAVATAAAYSDRYCIKHKKPVHFSAMDILTCMPDPDKMSTASGDEASAGGSQSGGGSQHGGSQHGSVYSGRKSPGHLSPPASGHGSPSRGRSASIGSTDRKSGRSKSRSASAGPSGTKQGSRNKRSPNSSIAGSKSSHGKGGKKKHKDKGKAVANYADKIAGCGGAEPWDAWTYISEVGICTEECKPLYKFFDASWLKIKLPKCKAKCTAKRSKIDYQDNKKSCGTPAYFSKYAELPDNIVEIMEQEIKKNGPIVASIDVHSDFFFYRKGVYSRTKWSPKVGEHAIRLIGWGTQTCTHSLDGRVETHKFWLGANTWGVHWGEDGFVKMRKGTDECGIESESITYAPILKYDGVAVKKTKTM